MNWSVRSFLTQTLVASSALAMSTAAFAAETGQHGLELTQPELEAAEADGIDRRDAALERAVDVENRAFEAADAEAARATPAPVNTPPSISLAPSFARSDEATKTKNSFHADMDLKFRVQPLGLVLATRMYNEYEYMRDNSSLLFSHVFLRGGLAVNLSPAYAEGGLDIEFQPIRIFSIRAQYLAGYHFGTFKYMLGYDTPNPITRDDELKAIADEAMSGVHQRIEVAPTFQVALGKIAVRNSFLYQRVWYSEEQFGVTTDGSNSWLRESSYDRMVQTDGDTILSNMLLVAYSVWDPDGPADAQMLIGPFHEWTRGVAAHKASPDGENHNRHRVGLTGVLIPKHNWGRVYKPRLILQAGYNIVDRENGRANRMFLQGSLGFTLHGRQ